MANNRDEVLRKARKSKRDEREEKIETMSHRIGWLSVIFVLLILLGFRWYFNESSADLLLILNTQLTATIFYQYKKYETKNYLIAGILMAGGVLMTFASVLSQYGIY